MEHDNLMDDLGLYDVLELVKNKSLEEITEEFSNRGGDDSEGQKNATGATIEEILQENKKNDSSAFLNLLRKSSVSLEEFQDSVRKIGLEQGYALVIKRSKPAYYVIMGCDRGGKYHATMDVDEKKRFTGTRLINCPFEIWGKKKAITWVVEIKSLAHNHESSKNMSGHPICRRFSEEQIQIIKTLSKAGSASREILTALRQNNLTLQANAMTVYNARAKIKRHNLGGHTMIEALFDELG